MIGLNNPMKHEQTEKPTEPSKTAVSAPQKPNESTGLNIDEHVKIFDPETKKVWLEKRA